jgi:hypothetical protein
LPYAAARPTGLSSRGKCTWEAGQGRYAWPAHGMEKSEEGVGRPLENWPKKLLKILKATLFPVLNRIQHDSKSNEFLLKRKTKARDDSNYNTGGMKCNKQIYIYIA